MTNLLATLGTWLARWPRGPGHDGGFDRFVSTHGVGPPSGAGIVATGAPVLSALPTPAGVKASKFGASMRLLYIDIDIDILRPDHLGATATTGPRRLTSTR